MKHVHARSPCCQGNIIHYGDRRRQCTKCGATWSIRPRKQGRKRRRISRNLMSQVFSDKRTLSSLARRYQVSSSGMARRFRHSLQRRSANTRLSIPFHSHQYILIADGLWFSFNGKKWTLYIGALKPVAKNTARFLEPILLPGKENAVDWNRVIADIPEPIGKRIKAFVSDGFRGSKPIVKRY